MVIAMFFVYFGSEHQKVSAVNHQQKCNINGIFCTFDMKSKHEVKRLWSIDT